MNSIKQAILPNSSQQDSQQNNQQDRRKECRISLTPQQSAGRMVMVRLTGTSLTPEDAAFLRDHHIRAVCLFRQNMRDAAQLRKFTRDLRALMGPESLIALDQEGGAVVRTTWLPEPPSAMALGAADDVQLCFDVGAAVGRGVRSLGFNWNFAPVLDVNNNPENPVIAERSFGVDPVRVSQLALSWMDGCLSEGVACCVKHFPGHGDTNVDSHRALPTVRKSRAELDVLELAPFRQAAGHVAGHVAAQAARHPVTAAVSSLSRAGGGAGLAPPGTPAMMTAHIIYPALDPEHPATMSRAILTDVLRGEWHYDGVVITDSMDMHAISENYGVASAAVSAVAAGADMVMALGSRADQMATLSALSEAIVGHRLAADAIAASVLRLEQLVQAYPCPSEDEGEDEDEDEDEDRDQEADAASMHRIGDAGHESRQQNQSQEQSQEQDRRLMATAWARGLTAWQQPKAPPPGSRVRLVMRQTVVSDGVSEPGIEAQQLLTQLQTLYEVELVTYTDAETADWASLAGRGTGKGDAREQNKDTDPVVILASTTRRRYGPNAKATWHPDVHLVLWNPYLALDIAAPALISYGFAAPAIAAVLDWLAGKLEPGGIWPLQIH